MDKIRKKLKLHRDKYKHNYNFGRKKLKNKMMLKKH